MHNRKYYNPVTVINTDNWLETCMERIADLHIKNPLIITMKGGQKRLDLEKTFSPQVIFNKVIPNPTFESCQVAIEFCRRQQFDGVIAIGGGSVMDTAKAVMAAITSGLDDIHELINTNHPYPFPVSSLFIPTTHGTGSEVTMWGTIWNTKEKQKYSISHPVLYPDVAILDGSLTLSLPLDISLITILDTLSHGFESLWNKNRNPTSTEYAIEAICMVLANVGKLKGNLKDLIIRKELLQAATTAGLAFSNTTTAAAHSISYPLTAYFGVPHGIAASITLLPLLDINGPSIRNEIDRIIKKLELDNPADLKSLIKDIPSGILKYSLREWGVQKSQLSWLADLSLTKSRMGNNIVDLSQEKVKWILETIYN